MRCKLAVDVDGWGSGTRDRQFGSQELLSLLSSLLHRHEVRLALMGSVRVAGRSVGRMFLLLLLLHGGGMLLGLIELDTRLDRDLIGDSEAAGLASGSVSIGSGALGRTIAIVGFSLWARFFTILWIFSSSCLVNVCDSVTCSTMVLLLDALPPSAVVTRLNPTGIVVLLRDDEACMRLVLAPVVELPPAAPVRLRDLWVFDLLALWDEGFRVLNCS